MDDEERRDDRDAVLDVVRAFFTREDREDDLVAGPLLTWIGYPQASGWYDRYEHERTVTSAEVVRLEDAHAVVDVRARAAGTARRGSGRYSVSNDGPVAL